MYSCSSIDCCSVHAGPRHAQGTTPAGAPRLQAQRHSLPRPLHPAAHHGAVWRVQVRRFHLPRGGLHDQAHARLR